MTGKGIYGQIPEKNGISFIGKYFVYICYIYGRKVFVKALFFA